MIPKRIPLCPLIPVGASTSHRNSHGLVEKGINHEKLGAQRFIYSLWLATGLIYPGTRDTAAAVCNRAQ